MCVILIAVAIGTKVINALLLLTSNLVTQKYLHYSTDITTEQVLGIWNSLMQKLGFSKMCHDFVV